jgi:hypothetical protein
MGQIIASLAALVAWVFPATLELSRARNLNNFMYYQGRQSPPYVLAGEAPGGFSHPMEDSMYAALSQKKSASTPEEDGGSSCGVEIFVHWGVYESGKTWAARNVGFKLQEEEEARVMFLRGYDHTFQLKSVREWLRLSIGGDDTPLKTGDSPTVVIIDHFDQVLDHYGLADTVHALRRELRDKDKQRVVKVLLLVTSWELALELRDDGKCKLVCQDAACGRWTYDQLGGVWDTLPLKTRLQWTDEDRAKLLRLCVETGAVGDLVFHVEEKSRFSDKNLARRGAVLNNEWSMGIRALDGHAEPGDVGVFPDRHGRYRYPEPIHVIM